MLTRRAALATAGAAATEFFVPTPADAASSLPKLEFSTPASHVRAFIKILASLEDDTIFDSEAPWEGRVNAWTDYPQMRTPER